jgi:hypothetical protein
MENKDMIEDIITLLDSSVLKGVGHLNITALDSQCTDRIVDQLGCVDCENSNLACNIPTLHEGIDTTEEE